MPVLLGPLEVAGHSLLHKRRSGGTREFQGRGKKKGKKNGQISSTLLLGQVKSKAIISCAIDQQQQHYNMYIHAAVDHNCSENPHCERPAELLQACRKI